LGHPAIVFPRINVGCLCFIGRLPDPEGTPVGRADLRKLNGRLAKPMSQPPPSGGELGRLTPIYRWLAFAGLRQAEQSFELFEFF
jgi:hypothetical protein